MNLRTSLRALILLILLPLAAFVAGAWYLVERLRELLGLAETVRA